MTSQPTKLNPWFIVFKTPTETTPYMYWHSPGMDDFATWKPESKNAMLFMSLNSAAVIADMEDAEIRPIWKREQLEDYQS